VTEALPAKPPREVPFPAPRHPVPLDLVLALPTSSVMRALIQERRNRGDRPKSTAQVFANGRQYFAIIDFEGDRRPGLLIPLDVFVWEPWGEGG